MSLVRFLYDNDFDSIFDDSLFHPVFVQKKKAESGNNEVTSFKPKIDIHEDKESNVVTATFELPGMKKEDISIDVHHDRITISGESNTSSEAKQHGYTVRERRFGKFNRSIKLPKGVKPESIGAKMENGLLTVTFPATGPENAPSRITID